MNGRLNTYLVELHFIQDESDKRAVIFHVLTVFKTDTRFSCTIHGIRIPWGKQLNRRHFFFKNSDKIKENGIRKLIVVRNITQPIT